MRENSFESLDKLEENDYLNKGGGFMDKCDGCIHDNTTGCMMLDCPRHPNTEEYAISAMTNTFRDRFMDRKENFDDEEG